MDAWMISYKQRAYCLHCSSVVVHTEHSQWQSSFIWEKSACLVEVSVAEQILQKSPNNLSMCKQCFFSSPPMYKSLGTRLVIDMGSTSKIES